MNIRPTLRVIGIGLLLIASFICTAGLLIKLGISPSIFSGTSWIAGAVVRGASGLRYY